MKRVTPQPLAFSSLNLLPALLLVLSAASGCAAPIAGRWQGTADVGPINAYDLRLEVASDGKSGRIAVQDGSPGAHDLCRIELNGRDVDLEYDLAQPTCRSEEGKPSDRRRLRGTVGEGLVFGEVLQGSQRIGFFRAYLAAAEPQ